MQNKFAPDGKMTKPAKQTEIPFEMSVVEGGMSKEERRRAYAKSYREKNKSRLDENIKNWRKANPDWGKKYRQENKAIISIKDRKYRDENKERVADSVTKWRKANPEKTKVYYKRYREKNKDKVNTRLRIYRKKNKEKVRQWERNKNVKHKDRIGQYNKVYYQNNKQRLLGVYNKWKGENKERIVGYNLKKLYGLSIQEYNDMAESQSGKCAICGMKEKGKRLAVDHCHTYGKVRGLLCSRCNMALGSLKDSPEILQKAILYLQESK